MGFFEGWQGCSEGFPENMKSRTNIGTTSDTCGTNLDAFGRTLKKTALQTASIE